MTFTFVKVPAMPQAQWATTKAASYQVQVDGVPIGYVHSAPAKYWVRKRRMARSGAMGWSHRREWMPTALDGAAGPVRRDRRGAARWIEARIKSDLTSGVVAPILEA